MSARIVGIGNRACIVGIIAGIVCMIQPFVFALFKWGFLLLLFATLAYIVVSHLPDRSSAASGSAVTEDLPISLSSNEDFKS